MRQCRNLRERRVEQSPFLVMIHPSDCDECRDHRTRAQIAPSSSPHECVGIDKPVRRRATESQDVAVLELVPASNPLSVEERAFIRLEIDHVVTAAFVPDDRMAIRDARVGEMQSRAVRAADTRLVALEQQQPRAQRLAIHRQQTCSLRSSEHLRLLPVQPAHISSSPPTSPSRQNTNALPFAAGAVGVSVQYGGSPLALGARTASSLARSCWQLL